LRDPAGSANAATCRGGQNGSALQRRDIVRTWAKYAQMNHP
jgi:hypothetical protein